MNLCFNCAGFNHNGKKCNNMPKCIFCVGNHVAKNCSDGRQYRCDNCTYANEKYGTKYKTDHMACDSQACEILKKKLKISIGNTDYPIKPIIPKYIGPVNPSIIKNLQRQSDSIQTEDNNSRQSPITQSRTKIITRLAARLGTIS